MVAHISINYFVDGAPHLPQLADVGRRLVGQFAAGRWPRVGVAPTLGATTLNNQTSGRLCHQLVCGASNPL
jgi:hypothetical protein